jgi:hypothetical protein
MRIKGCWCCQRRLYRARLGHSDMLRGSKNATGFVRSSSRFRHPRESLYSHSTHPFFSHPLCDPQYLPAANHKPLDMELLSKQLPKLTYNLYFQRNTDEAIAELDQDIRRSLRSMLRNVASPPPETYLTSRTSFLEAYQHMDTIPPSPLMTPEEEDYYVEQYTKQGFKHSKQSNHTLQVHNNAE